MTVESFQPADLTPMSAAVNLPELPAEMAVIVQWANTAGAAQALVERIVDTPFMPAAFWPKFDPRDREAAQHARQQAVASGTAAVLYGGPLGLNPLQSLANIHVVKGKPGLPAELMVALVRSHGHEVGIEDLTDHRCRVWGRRKGSEELHRSEFTMERAKKAGYTSQNAKYGTDPQAMLYARAVSILCRQMASEVLKGLATVEEIGDEPDADAPAPKGRVVQRAAALQAAMAAPAQRPAPALAPAPAPARQATPSHAEAPSGPPLPGEDEPATEAARPIEADQWRAINARFVELHVSGPGKTAKRMTVVSTIIGRTLTRGGEMTSVEASLVLDSLSGPAGDRVVADVLGADALADDEPDAPAAAESEQPTEARAPVEAEQEDLEPSEDDPWANAGAQA